MKSHQFRKLYIWQRAISYVNQIYKVADLLPKKESFVIGDQIKRAVVSISLNIAEGSGSISNQEFIRFLYMAKRSAYEVITCLEIIKNQKYLTQNVIDKYIHEAEEICSMITSFISNLKNLS